MRHNRVDPKFTSKCYSEEDITKYKIYEVVLCRGVKSTIRDIYVRTFRYTDNDGNEQFGKHLSYRMHEKEFQAQDVCFEDIQKLNSEIAFLDIHVPKNLR